MRTGGCGCGAVTFELEGAVRDVYVCHCSICRRFTGTNGVAVVVVPNAAFRWTGRRDTIRTWDKPGHDWSAHFCDACGSTLPGPNDDARMFVPAGLLDDDGGLQVAHHIFVDSKAAWEIIGDAARQHPEAFGSGDSGH